MMNEVCWFWYVLGLRVDIYIYIHIYMNVCGGSEVRERYIYIRWGGFGVCVVG